MSYRNIGTRKSVDICCSWTLGKRRSGLWTSDHPTVGLEGWEEHAFLRCAVKVEMVSSVRLERFGPRLASTDARDPSNWWFVLLCKYLNFSNKITILGDWGRGVSYWRRKKGCFQKKIYVKLTKPVPRIFALLTNVCVASVKINLKHLLFIFISLFSSNTSKHNPISDKVGPAKLMQSWSGNF